MKKSEVLAGDIMKVMQITSQELATLLCVSIKKLHERGNLAKIKRLYDVTCWLDKQHTYPGVARDFISNWRITLDDGVPEEEGTISVIGYICAYPTDAAWLPAIKSAE